MNKVFHARITWYYYLYLIILAATSFMLLWQKHIIPAVILIIFLIILIERIINTAYTITANGRLILFHGRFSKKRTILISKIHTIDRVETLKIGTMCLTSYLLISYENGFVALIPVKEDEFISSLQRINSDIIL